MKLLHKIITIITILATLYFDIFASIHTFMEDMEVLNKILLLILYQVFSGIIIYLVVDDYNLYYKNNKEI